MPLFHVASLWEHKTEDGKKTLQGKLSNVFGALAPDIKVILLPNTDKESESQPSHKIFIATPDEEGGKKGGGKYPPKNQQKGTGGKYGGGKYSSKNQQEQEEEVPF